MIRFEHDEMFIRNYCYLKWHNRRKLKYKLMDFPGGSDGKESSCSAGNPDSIPGSSRSHGEGNGNPLPVSCLENSRDRGAWQATVHGITKSQTQLSD